MKKKLVGICVVLMLVIISIPVAVGASDNNSTLQDPDEVGGMNGIWFISGRLIKYDNDLKYGYFQGSSINMVGKGLFWSAIYGNIDGRIKISKPYIHLPGILNNRVICSHWMYVEN